MPDAGDYGWSGLFLLKGCGDGGNTDNDGDGTFYATVNDCIDDGNSASVCADGWNNAKTEFYANVPKQLTQERCQTQFGDCYFDITERSWVPVLSGFYSAARFVRTVMNNTSIAAAVHLMSPVPSGAPHPATMRGAAAQGKAIPRPAPGYITRKASTVSRGGYGRSSSARGHWEANHATTQRTDTPGSG